MSMVRDSRFSVAPNYIIAILESMALKVDGSNIWQQKSAIRSGIAGYLH